MRVVVAVVGVRRVKDFLGQRYVIFLAVTVAMLELTAKIEGMEKSHATVKRKTNSYHPYRNNHNQCEPVKFMGRTV